MLTIAASLDASSIPFRLVASKCDIQPPHGLLEPVLDGYEILRTSPDSPRSQKMCIALVLRSVISERNGKCFSADILFLSLESGVESTLLAAVFHYKCCLYTHGVCVSRDSMSHPNYPLFSYVGCGPSIAMVHLMSR